ncbi:MAG: AmmeMemoRadiSam system protein B [Bacteroidales bacterium]|nr:AmmeMemoRadiSam system protein B [Bacteroidales bacterium]
MTHQKIIVATLISFLMMFSCSGLSAQVHISLFNGHDLTGWHADVPAMDDGPEVKNPFIVRDGLLVSLGTPGGHLITDSVYQNYRLEVEYRFAGKPGNCGVLVHASTPRALYNMFPQSLEVQMQHQQAGDFWCIVEDISVPDMIKRRGSREKWGIVEGKNRHIENLTNGSENPVGEWNSLAIECIGREIEVWVNGDLVNHGYHCTADKGQIALQAEGSEVEFRKLDLFTIRQVVDTVGFAQYDWQMDSIVQRLDKRVNVKPTDSWKAVIAPHDDYKYAGEVTYQTMKGIKANTIILFGVAHKASKFNLDNKLIFGSYSYWKAPYGKIAVSPIREEIMEKLPSDLWIVHDSMQMIEHSLEALTPFLQNSNRDVTILPILVPYMDFARMDEISDALSDAITEVMRQKNWVLGKDVAIVISTDGVHYGNEDWGGKNMAPFGTDKAGNAKATKLDHEIIDNCLKGRLGSGKIKRFVNYTVDKSDYHQYKWTWCGRYSVPLGLLVANKLNENMYDKRLFGHFIDYASSIDHQLFTVEDIGMGITAPATPRHWVSYVGMGYK